MDATDSSPDAMTSYEYGTSIHRNPSSDRPKDLKSFKRCSEDMEEEEDPHYCSSRAAAQNATRVFDSLAASVRMKKNLRVEDTDKASSSHGDIGSEIDPDHAPVELKVRAKGPNALFLTVDRTRQRPKMEKIQSDNQEEMKRATFVFQQYFSKDGDLCTLRHKRSGAFLAVDKSTQEPTLRFSTTSPVNLSSATDFSLRTPFGRTQPLSLDQPDSSFPTTSSSSEPDRCCFFDFPRDYTSQPVRLTPTVCPHKTLSFNGKTGEVFTVNLPHDENFELHHVRKKLRLR